MFARVMAVAFDDADNLYVLDTGNHRVVVFGPDGGHIRTIGRQGGGPGEFNLPSALAVLSNGELVVADVMRADVQRFGRDGKLLGSFAMGDRRASGRVQAHPRGGFVSLATRPPTTRMEGPPPPRVDELHWFRGGDLASQPIFLGQPREMNTTQMAAPAGSGANNIMMRTPPAFAPTLHWGVLPNGEVVVVPAEEYRIEVRDAAGRTTRVLERPIQPRRVTERDREAYRERQRNATIVFQGGPPGFSGEARADNLTFNDRIPTIRSMLADPFGRLWVSRWDDPSQPTGPIDLIDAVNGTYLGTLPAQPLPAAFSGTGRAAWIERDEFDVQRVVVRQIPQAPR
jgi:hypothetical protein